MYSIVFPVRSEPQKVQNDRRYVENNLTLPPEASRGRRDNSAQEIPCTVYIKLKNIVSINLKLFNQVNTNKSCTNCKIKVNVRILKTIETIQIIV